MRGKKQKRSELKVSYEYEPTPDGDEKFTEIFEFLLSNPDNTCQKSVSSG